MCSLARIVIVVAALAVVGVHDAGAHRCTGDCDDSDTVTINELVSGVGIALDQLPLTFCFAFDADLDGDVSINELLVAVNNVFSYCGHGAPPTPSSIRTGTPTPTAEVQSPATAG